MERREILEQTLAGWEEKHQKALEQAKFCADRMHELIRELGLDAMQNVVVINEWLATPTPYPQDA